MPTATHLLHQYDNASSGCDNDSCCVVCVVDTEAVWQARCYCASASTLASTGSLAQSDTAASWSVSKSTAWGGLQSGSPARFYARTAVPTRQSSAAGNSAAAASLGRSAGPVRACPARLWWLFEISSECTLWEMMLLHLILLWLGCTRPGWSSIEFVVTPFSKPALNRQHTVYRSSCIVI